jgi:chromatin remodeling complex protein RSC6
MVRASKTSTPVTAPVDTTPAVVDASQKTAAPKAPRAKKVVAKEETPVVVETIVVSPPATVDAAATNELTPAVAGDIGASLAIKMTDFSAKLQLLVGILSTLKNDYKSLEKIVSREMKNAKKASSKKRRINANRKPSGFIKPTRISDELAEFLGKTIGTEMARTEVSKEINTYIHSNGLQDKSNGRKINPDPRLTKLLKLSKEDELTYFNLQRYMKHHFIKAEVLDAAAAVAAAAVASTA